jgi:dihydroorotase
MRKHVSSSGLTRRHFSLAVLSGAAALSRAPKLFAATYDLVVKGGRVIDPSLGIDAIRDVAVAGGRIVAVQADIAAGAADIIDARGKLVVPGLIDIHTHLGRAADLPAICLADGVTSFVDAGSQGADRIDEVVAVMKAAPNRGRVLINIARTGILPDGELMDLKRADVDAARKAIERHRDFIVGIKARLSKNVAGAGDLEALKRAQDAAKPFNLPVMIHMGQTVSPLPKILELLKRGDVVTHLYAPDQNGIFDSNGRLLKEVADARRRGVWFDFGNGRAAHVTWDLAERGVQQGFPPDTISTDWTPEGRPGQVVDFPNVMSKFLLLGMPLEKVIACATVNPARIFDAFKGLGTLKVGAQADIAVLELREGTFEFVDNYTNKKTGRQRLFPIATVMGGKRTAPRA